MARAIDWARYDRLKAEGHSEREIAVALAVPRTTLGRELEKREAEPTAAHPGTPPMDHARHPGAHPGPPARRLRHTQAHLGTPATHPTRVHHGTPSAQPTTVHPSTPAPEPTQVHPGTPGVPENP